MCAANRQVAELKVKNSELQKKLGILAQKIESYREEEDGIKEAILSAQRMGKEALQDAKGKAAVMMADAEENAKKILENARDDAARAAREYANQVEQKRSELEEMKRQVSAFRVSLLEMYKKHLESINHIPSFRVKEPVQKAEAPAYEEQPVPADPEPVREPVREAEPQPEPQPVPQQREEPQPVVQPKPQPVRQPAPRKAQEAAPSLHDKVDLSREQLEDGRGYHPDDDDISQVGLDLKAYSYIPESLQKEKASHFSNLEFGDNVDLGNKRRKR